MKTNFFVKIILYNVDCWKLVQQYQVYSAFRLSSRPCYQTKRNIQLMLKNCNHHRPKNDLREQNTENKLETDEAKMGCREKPKPLCEFRSSWFIPDPMLSRVAHSEVYKYPSCFIPPSLSTDTHHKHTNTHTGPAANTMQSIPNLSLSSENT